MCTSQRWQHSNGGVGSLVCMGVWGVQGVLRVRRGWEGGKKGTPYGIILIWGYPPNFVGLPKIHKNWHPPRCIVSSRGSITYGVAKELVNIICPLVNQSPHHLNNTHHFIQHIKEIKLEPGEVMTSYDVKTLFTSVPVDPSINIVKQNYNRIHFSHKGPACPYHKQSLSWSFASKTHTSSSKVSIMNRSMVLQWIPSLVLSLPTCLWKSLRSRSLALPHTHHLWLRFVDNTLVIQQAKHSQQLLQHINSQDPHIQFSVEEPNQERTLPFLASLVSSGPNNTLATTVYRKPTHTNQYLHWDSNHFTTAKNSVFNTLAFRDKVVCTRQQALPKEMKHIGNALQACNFPPWALNNLQNKFNLKHNIHNGN